jgi:hypothetical protein
MTLKIKTEILMTSKILYSGLAVLAALSVCSLPARADFVFSIEPSVSAIVGSTGNTFEVFLTNTGGSDVTVSGFSFGITTDDTDVTFTGATTSTVINPYIFAGDSFDDTNSFPLNTLPPPPGQTLEASDFSNSPGDVVSAGETVSVGLVSYDVSDLAVVGPADVNFEPFPTTSLTDSDFNNLPFNVSPGAILIRAAIVPEPTTSGLLICALMGLAIEVRRRRAQAIG